MFVCWDDGPFDEESLSVGVLSDCCSSPSSVDNPYSTFTSLCPHSHQDTLPDDKNVEYGLSTLDGDEQQSDNEPTETNASSHTPSDHQTNTNPVHFQPSGLKWLLTMVATIENSSH